LLDQLVELVSAMIADPERSLGDLVLSPPAVVPREAASPIAAAVRVEDAVFAQAALTRDRIAVIAGACELSYGELAHRAAALAELLGGAGVVPGAVVGLCLPRGADAAVAMVGILRAGAAYLPLDPSYPPQRLAFMLEQARARVIVGDAEVVRRLELSCDRVIELAPIGDETRAGPEGAEGGLGVAAPDPARTASSAETGAAYVLFTSGSTGQPKGVVMPHRPLANLIAWQARTGLASPQARTLQFAPYGFDVSFQEVFCTLSSGGTLVMLDEQQRRDPFAIWEVIRSHRVERVFLPFVALQQLAEAFLETRVTAASLREVITAGEALHLTPALLELFRLHPQARLINQYGPTETHVVTSYALPADVASWRGLPPIGRPIDDTQIWILDARGRRCPVGVLGEVWVSGAAVALGYLHNEKATAERFCALSELAEGMCYRTGDLARLRADGEIEFVGRRDHQLKVRGHRVELGEVEAALRAHPGVAIAAVVPYGQGQATRLVAYLVAREAAVPPVASELRRFLATRLPDPFLPQAFVWLPELPRTPSGKLDRGALPEPALTEEARPGFVAPANVIETAVAGAWQAALGVERVGRDDNFFELGGHSLLLMQVYGKLKKAYPQAALRLVELFEHTTVKTLAERIAGGHSLDAELAESARRGERRRRVGIRLQSPTSMGDNDV
jgi:amino acid adenylation domain-containing protein